MDLYAAQQLALGLMQEHGLLQSGWRFRWSHGQRRFGCAQVTRRRHPLTRTVIEVRTIRLSRHLTSLNRESEVRDTMLHEIAHALVGVEHGHDAAWRAMCVKIGARPMRLCGEEVVTPEPRYVVVCGTCSRALGKRHRRMAESRLRQSYCRHCGLPSKGTLRVQAVV